MTFSIEKGTASVSIHKIQQCLNQINPQLKLKEDGIYNDQTEQAILEFQKSTGLDPTGIINSLTWDKIILKIKTIQKSPQLVIQTEPPLSYGSQGLDVLKAQQYLNQIQPDHPIETDGLFLKDTQVKVIRFQNMCGLNPDGRIGLLTWDKMIEYL